MRFFDAWKIAFHNMRVNKSRTVLTIVIVLIVSSLMMTLCLFGISFYKNQLSYTKQIFENGGTDYLFTGKIDSESQDLGISADELSVLNSVAEKYKQVINRKYAIPYGGRAGLQFEYAFAAGFEKGSESSEEGLLTWLKNNNDHLDEQINNSIQLADFTMYDYPGKNIISAGRVWTADDIGKNGIWVSDYTVKAFTDKGISIGVGSTVAIKAKKTIYFSDGRDERVEESVKTFVVRGIFDEKDMVNDGYFIESLRSVNYIIDGNYFMDVFKNEENVFREIVLSYRPPETQYDYNAVKSVMRSFTKEVNEKILPNIEDGSTYERFTCIYLRDLAEIMLISSIFTGLIVSLAFLVLLLSVGSVANTIMISVDKNRKFIGLMKALGLNQRGVKKIVSFESLFLIVVGVLLGILVLLAVRPAVASVMQSLFTLMFSYYVKTVAVSVVIPIYLPVVTMVAFFLFAMLFSRGALTGIAKQDAIQTINEVA